MNPIEHLWTILKRNVHLRKPKNIKELEKYVVEEWYKIPKFICEKLVFSMNDRIFSLFEAKGHTTKY
ncbi:hypothetical protein A0H76_2001 [Hepatospora eriocheir]|uniref:TCB2 n=1 Tax=Hepatospora eriocheir TaxID=1081669 RepID=A0A1X0QG07_9MICR|nr:hypothetical protein A0H76_2001 [Hepatospora eriocheir]